MWKCITKICVLFIALFVFSGQVLALRCGDRVVDVRANKSKVISRCGEPLYIETREEKYPLGCIENGYYGRRYQQQEGRYYPPVCRIELIEVWTYNFGPRNLMRELIFRKGILSKIELLGYGE